MNADIVDLRAFYHTRLGRLAAHSIAMALVPVWPKLPDERLVGLGYCLPYLVRLGTDAERVMAFMPASQGAINWPAHAASATALVMDEELPLPDASIDRVLMVHALEFTESPRETLSENGLTMSRSPKDLVMFSASITSLPLSRTSLTVALTVPCGP